MAFATKYRLNFKDYEDNSWSVLFQEDGFGGSVTDFTPGPDPVNIRWEGSDKYQAIVGSYAEIQMVYESACDNMYTEESDDIRVLIVKGGNTIWRGFLSPGQFQRHFNQPKHYATFTASDGLGELKDIKFLDGSGDPYFYQLTEIAVIAAILGKTGLDLTIVEAVNIFEASYDSTATDSPLEQTYIYTGKYYDEVTEESQDCYTVLEEILKKYGASIRHWDDYWSIMRPNEASLSTVPYRVFTSAGVYSSNSTTPGNYSMYDLSMQYIGADAELTKKIGVGSTEISLTPGVRANTLKNGIFNSFTWTGGNPYYWTNSGAGYNNTADTAAITIDSNGSASIPSNYLYARVWLYRAKSVRLTLEYKAVYTGSPTHAKVCIGVVFAGGSYYAPSADTWHSTSYAGGTSNVAYDLIADSKASMTDYETIIVEPSTGPWVSTEGGYGFFSYMDIRLYEFHNETGGSTNYWQLRHAYLEVGQDGTLPQTKLFTYDGPNNINSIHREELSMGDSYVTDLYASGNDDLFWGVTSDAAGGSGNETVEWYIRGDNPTVTTEIPIAELLAKQITEGYHRSVDVLRATFRGGESMSNWRGLTDPNFTDEYGYDKVFWPKSLNWNIRPVQWSGEWVECPVVYNTTTDCDEWASATYTGGASPYTITGNELEVNSCPGDGTGTYESYTAVAGETLRLVLVMVDDGSSDLPSFTVGGDAQTIAWGTTYLTYYCSSAGAKTIVIGGDDVGDTHNYTATLTVYYLTGI